jgi:hypothetical protein
MQTDPLPVTSPQRDRRTHERLDLHLNGRFWTEDQGEQICSLIDISPGGACVHADSAPPDDTDVVLMINSIGRIEGRVVRSTLGDFSIVFTSCAETREEISSRITWQFNKERLGFREERRGERLAGRGHDRITLEDGTILQAEIRDVSIGGVAFNTACPPQLGERVRVSSLNGVVIRHLDTGFAVAFDPPVVDQGEDEPLAPFKPITPH